MMRWIGCMLLWALVGCGSSDDDDGAGGGDLSLRCVPDSFQLEGELDGTSVDENGALSGHAWIQGGGGTLDVQFDGGGSFHAEWPKVIADGAQTAIDGEVIMPPGAARGGETLTYASGTMLKLDDGIAFEIGGLSAVVTCVTEPCPAEPVSGSLSGCADWTRL